MRTSILCSFVLVTGCTDMLGSDSSSIKGADGDRDGTYDRDECKIEGSAIGEDGVTVFLGAKSVSFHDWIGKDGSPGEYIGFSLSLSGGSTIGYVVKTGGELHPSDATFWIHPNGNAGSASPGISNVDFCEECEGGGCDGGGGDDGGGDDGGGGGDDGGGGGGDDGGGGGGGGGGDDGNDGGGGGGGGGWDNPDGCDGGGGAGDDGSDGGDGGGGTVLPPASFPGGSDVPDLQGLGDCGNPDGCDGGGGGSGPVL